MFFIAFIKLNYIDFCLRWYIDSGLAEHNHLHTSHAHKRVSTYPQVHTNAQARPSLGGKQLLVTDWTTKMLFSISQAVWKHVYSKHWTQVDTITLYLASNRSTVKQAALLW